MKHTIHTVESVTSGHPDKVCDAISDSVLDAFLAVDPHSRVAVETFGSHGLLVIGGEVTSKGVVDAGKIGRAFYRSLGYTDDLQIMTNIVQQSPDIAQGVDTGGAGDQGIMYGYATAETPEFMPRAVALSHKLTQGLEQLRRTDPECAWLGPDGKSQVTMQDGKVTTVLISCQHADSVSQEQIKDTLVRKLIRPVVGDLDGVEVLVNPTGKFTIGGFAADTGLTGRKIVVDTYGGLVPHGGGAFSGKDPTKVDRSAAYMSRFAAKNIVANGVAKECTVTVAYAIGRADPLMVYAEADDGRDLSAIVKEKFDFRPKAIIERLNLRRPIYARTAAYGHFGRDGFPWEEVVSL
ncbi:MAG: methionine adenosyltransferase [Candidatus Sungbacteria bacterium RIFCSPLOWO2_01_FULL_54_21]|uniref:Methionine adenosyltransferase n=2 Tax=Candidatus Sungiibacteriota TaxID=1817917 RepID=A0A1G2L9A7_9BACT|nr:MAG: methionine adenosyltransferase [Candidatus Sungbacteria bacterium RIFCSPHIGHO2_01_FULL_54_26]OHA02593.1 MAG: methionine adenosyltransferase [Candidatus Sungbacteria bacterium RIFCSPHIGHO2_02_FULL_53_17]OHA07392.1 MAG: methionine adenosyltransferase [Candidatus Sungbacteria bacterium RIFCSPLOWO2_01_FULL_54_21]